MHQARSATLFSPTTLSKEPQSLGSNVVVANFKGTTTFKQACTDTEEIRPARRGAKVKHKLFSDVCFCLPLMREPRKIYYGTIECYEKT